MPNWVKLVEHTAEFVPGPYTATRGERDSDTIVYIRAMGQPLGQRTVGAILETFAGVAAKLKEGEQVSDYAQEATARLVADAPEMLMLLARFLNCTDAFRVVDGVEREVVGRLLYDVQQIVVKHVRLGCAPVDAENRKQPSLPGMEGDVGEFVSRDKV